MLAQYIHPMGRFWSMPNTELVANRRFYIKTQISSSISKMGRLKTSNPCSPAANVGDEACVPSAGTWAISLVPGLTEGSEGGDSPQCPLKYCA